MTKISIKFLISLGLFLLFFNIQAQDKIAFSKLEKNENGDYTLNGIRYTAELNKITPYPNDTKIMNASIVLTKK